MRKQLTKTNVTFYYSSTVIVKCTEVCASLAGGSSGPNLASLSLDRVSLGLG